MRPVSVHRSALRMQTKSWSSRFGALDKQRSFPPRNRMFDAKCRVFVPRVIEQWHDQGDVSDGFWWKRMACREVVFIPRRTRVIGRKESSRSETIVHLFEVGGARKNV